jgi:hypothetical protein
MKISTKNIILKFYSKQNENPRFVNLDEISPFSQKEEMYSSRLFNPNI